jgi:FkbM family methyltransferase
MLLFPAHGTHKDRPERKSTLMGKYKSTLSRLFELGAFPEDAFYIHKAFQGQRIIVYGAGESFHYFKEVVMRQYGYMPSVVLDRKFCRGNTFEGIPAFSPLEYEPSSDEKLNGLVVVCLGRQQYFDQVVQTLRNMGFRNIISLVDIYEIHNPFRLPLELEEGGFRYYINQKERIESGLEILADELSREVFIRCLQTHMQRKPVAVPMCDRNEQYTPQGIQLARGYSRFIYCGVSVGEMSRVFSQVGKVDELVCFEPDPNQFKLTAEYLATRHEHIAQRVTAIPCAVYSHEAIAAFTYSDTSFGSRILTSGEARIQCVSIDHVLPGFHPTFISMDIEGAELEALKGAEKTLRESRPDLGICVYHCPSHLWEIPLYLHNLGVGYRLYLRNYTSFTGETVLYAVA